ncbi:MAG: hypothetical protein AAB473_00390 [Patescibacteria group bacterium]
MNKDFPTWDFSENRPLTPEVKHYEVENVRSAVDQSREHLSAFAAERIKECRTRAHCATIANEVGSLLVEKIPGIRLATSDDTTSEYHPNHAYLVVKGLTPDTDIIIDPTAGQFITGLSEIYIGTRSNLRQLILNPETTIQNTSSKDHREETFNRIWGSGSKITGLLYND